MKVNKGLHGFLHIAKAMEVERRKNTTGMSPKKETMVLQSKACGILFQNIAKKKFEFIKMYRGVVLCFNTNARVLQSQGL